MTAPFTVVDVDCARGEYRHERDRFRAAGIDFVLRPAATEDAIIVAAADADVLLLEQPSTPITARVVEALRRCRAIVKYSVGVENVDLPTAARQGIVVCNAPDYCTEDVSDHAVALLLAGARRIVAMDRHIRAGRWSGCPQIMSIRRIKSMTLGVVGMGRIGRATARKMLVFGMRILVTDPNLPAGWAEPGLERVTLDALLRDADLVSVHVPLSAQTRGCIGAAELALMKPTAIIVNTSRGPVIDESALVRALRDGLIAGAALDVFEVEPLPPDSPLREFENVTLTPHFGAGSIEARAECVATVVTSIEAVARGYWPPFPVNPDVRPRFPLRPWAEFKEA